jgi:hypothetical protein
MKKIITTFYCLTTIVSLTIGQVANDDCAGAIDYGVLNGRMTCPGQDGAMYDTCFTVTNLNAIPNFPFYYTDNFCAAMLVDTVTGIHNDVWYKVHPSVFYVMSCFQNSWPPYIDTAKITFWTEDGTNNGCGHFWGGTTQLIPLSIGYYQNVFDFFGPSSDLYFQISGTGANDTTEFTMCLRGYSLWSGAYCGLTSSSYDSLCFAANLTPTNPTTINSNDGSISLSLSFGSPPYSLLWSTGDTTNQISGLAAGNYSVTITDSVGCSNSYSVNLTAPTSISEITTEQHAIYPNPTADFFQLDISGQKIIRIYNIVGNLCQTILTDKATINVSNLTAGVYLVIVECDKLDTPLTKRLIIERP